MSNTKAKRGAKPPHAPWPTVREESVFSLVHAYRMYLEVATLTEQKECRARNLKNAKRVRGQLRELIPAVRFGALMRHCVCVERLRRRFGLRHSERGAVHHAHHVG